MTQRLFKTGHSRQQASLLPPRIEDYVGPDNPVRAIDAFVDGLDLAALGFRHAEAYGGAGQPPFHPGDLLKLYLYGYTNSVRSSRRLERESLRNLEVIWLLRGLSPGYRTIATFRRDNAAALAAANRHLLGLARRLDLLGGEVVAIDGAFFHGDASRASITTKSRLAERLAALQRDIAAYDAALAENDAAEDEGLAALREKQRDVAADLATLQASGQTQLSRTHADARLLSKNGQSVAGYNVQIVVDAEHKLIVASEVVHDGNDTGQLHAMASAAKDSLGVASLTVAADAGYYNGETLKACEADAITPYVPEPERGGRAAAEGRFGEDAFAYDAAEDCFGCPAGQQLKPCGGKRDASGKWNIRYMGRRSVCGACPLRRQCLSAKATRREIWRWEHAEVTDRHRARMAADGAAGGAAMMRLRRSLVEHPFGTLKCRAGYRHFLVRGFAGVRGEWSLMALCYNLTWMVTILGLAGFIAAVFALVAGVLAMIGATVRGAWTRPSPVGRGLLCDNLFRPFMIAST